MSVGAVNKDTGDRIPTAGMPAIDDALDLTSVNPVQNAVITATLANKQDKTDNNLETTDKTVVGAINEHEGDIDSLKSGLTNYENQNNLNLEVPNRKNILNLSFEKIKALCNEGTWTGTSYVYNGVTFVFTVVDGYITKISISGTLTGNRSRVWIAYDEDMTNYNGCILNGCPDLGGTDYISIQIQKKGTPYITYAVDTGSGANINNISNNCQIYISIGASFDSQTPVDVYPMIRPATITDATFAPYIPSVESRIEAVESGLTSIFLPTSRLTAVNDLDGVIKPGAYYFRDADNPANAPASNCYIAVIRQYDNSPRIAQIAYSFSVNTIYVRKTLDWGSTWGDWYSLDNTQVTQ